MQPVLRVYMRHHDAVLRCFIERAAMRMLVLCAMLHAVFAALFDAMPRVAYA